MTSPMNGGSTANQCECGYGRMTKNPAEPKAPVGMKSVARIVFTHPDDEDEKPARTWHWYVRLSAADPDSQGRQSYALQPHLNDTKEAAARIVSGLSLESELGDAIILAAAHHDLGKDRGRWQNGIGNRDYPDVKWAKSAKYAAFSERLYYRHEFGSILDMAAEPSFERLSDDAKDLVLHLIAAHHGRARPHLQFTRMFWTISTRHRRLAILRSKSLAGLRGCSASSGAGGLAYLESLVRTADYAASAKAEESSK